MGIDAVKAGQRTTGADPAVTPLSSEELATIEGLRETLVPMMTGDACGPG